MTQWVKIATCGVVLALVALAAFGEESCEDYWNSTYAGLPRSDELDNEIIVLLNKGFIVGYSDTRMNPLWVCCCVFSVENPTTEERPSSFRVDKRTCSQVKHDDYTNSGYDRGHMAPNATISYCYGRDAQLETFFMSNVCPQAPTLNRGIWAKLEAMVRDWANTFEEVWVFTGPIFDDEVETIASGVEIPDAFYKIIVDEVNGSPRLISFVIPQEEQPYMELDSYLTSVDDVEEMVGFDFLWSITNDTEEAIESYIPTELWQTTSLTPVPEKVPGQPAPLPPIPSNVQITRIFYNGLVPRVESDEYVEIKNLGDEAQDLRGWTLKDISEGYPEFRFGSPYLLEPGVTIRVYTDEIHPEWGGFSFSSRRAIWNNEDPDIAVLYNAQGQEVSRKSY